MSKNNNGADKVRIPECPAFEACHPKVSKRMKLVCHMCLEMTVEDWKDHVKTVLDDGI
jgi:hypothetical protein